jgi:hypothetical protein
MNRIPKETAAPLADFIGKRVKLWKEELDRVKIDAAKSTHHCDLAFVQRQRYEAKIMELEELMVLLHLNR